MPKLDEGVGQPARAGSRAPVILLLAGEASGDLHGAHLARELKVHYPEARLLGLGGERMAAEGVELLAGLKDLAVMGFVEVLSRLPFFWRLERKVRRLLTEEGVDLVIPIDYPGFNLRITQRADELGIPVLYFIAPQVWAWKARRTGTLARAASRIAVILPFEEEIFRAEGGDAEFVGHPLLDRPLDLPDRNSFCRQAGLDATRPILAIFPGSRAQELRRHLKPFVAAGRRLAAQRPGLQLVLARASGVQVDLPAGDPPVTQVTDGQALLRHSRAALVKSGTSTLEAALEGTPFIVAYRTHPLSYRIAQRLVQVDYVALANLVVGEGVVPEFLQDEVTPSTLADALAPLLDESEERSHMLEDLDRVRHALGEPGAIARVAEIAREILDGEGFSGAHA